LAEISFNFYGLTIQVRSALRALAHEVQRDFKYFEVPSGIHSAKVYVEMHLTDPPYADFPSVGASFSTPRNICFKSGKTSFIDYFGEGLAVFDRLKNQCLIYGKEKDLVHEITYLFILSTVGRHLDHIGLHRVHALGVSHHNQGLLILLPSGGGKSTLALELLSHPDFMLLGEDTPLVDRRGRIFPFPLRLGIKPGKECGIPAKYLRTVKRMEFDPKTLIDIDYFAGRIGHPVEPGLILVGERNLGDISEIRPVSRFQASKALVKYMIVGLGIYQGLEFLLERSVLEAFGKLGIAASRTHNGLRLLSRSRAFRFIMGRNTLKNIRTLLEFVQKESG
jgi:hypothetical protein